MSDCGRAGLAVTGYAAANALGATLNEVVHALEDGRSGLKPCPLDLPFETTAGTFPDVLEPLPSRLSRYESRLARIAVTALDGLAPAVQRAARRWGGDRIAVVVGTSTGGILESERALTVHASEGRLPATYDFQSQHALDGILEVIRVRTGTRGPAFVVSTACSSSGKVFGSAQRLLASGVADAALVGGVDTLCQTTLRGFASLDALSSRPCRPFSSARDGTSLGEGAAFILLEREGDGPARLVGVGESSDAHHMSHPHPEGLGAVLAMSAALRAGAVEPSEIDYVNAHGTGTKVNDAVEARAIAEVLGSETPVTSTKGFTGHLLGAAGATEAVFSLFTLESGVAPASLGATPLDPAVSVRVLTTATRGRFRRVLSNSFGFGGSNVAIVFEATP